MKKPSCQFAWFHICAWEVYEKDVLRTTPNITQLKAACLHLESNCPEYHDSTLEFSLVV